MDGCGERPTTPPRSPTRRASPIDGRFIEKNRIERILAHRTIASIRARRIRRHPPFTESSLRDPLLQVRGSSSIPPPSASPSASTTFTTRIERREKIQRVHRSSRAHRHRSRRQRRHDECQVSRVAQSRRRARPRPRRSGLGGDSGTNRDSSFSYAGTHHDDGRHGLSGSSKKEKGPGFKKGRKSPSVTPLAMCAWGG